MRRGITTGIRAAPQIFSGFFWNRLNAGYHIIDPHNLSKIKSCYSVCPKTEPIARKQNQYLLIVLCGISLQLLREAYRSNSVLPWVLIDLGQDFGVLQRLGAS